MNKENISFFALTDTGLTRTVNEDNNGNYSTGQFDLFIVCDGMGGHNGGEIASKITVDTIKEHFASLEEDFNPKDELRNAFFEANKVISKKSSLENNLSGMGSTAVVLLIIKDVAYIAHLGDSRIYHLQNNTISQLTKDHSLIQEMLDAKLISKEDAETHPRKNVITKALGADIIAEPDISGPINIYSGDVFLLCTDGLSGALNTVEIEEIISNNDLQKAAKQLISKANERGGKDNITVQLIKKNKGPKLPFRLLLKNRNYFRFVYTSIVLAVVLPVFFYIMIDKIFYGNWKISPKPSKSNSNVHADSLKSINNNLEPKDSIINNVKDKK